MSRPYPKFKSSGTVSMTTTYVRWDLTNTQSTPTSMKLASLLFYVSSIASSASIITCKVTRDTLADELVLPEWTVTLGIGATTATDGTALSLMDSFIIPPYSTLYLWVKTNTGSCTGDSAVLVGEA